MSLSPGIRIGPYDVTSLFGEGPSTHLGYEAEPERAAQLT